MTCGVWGVGCGVWGVLDWAGVSLSACCLLLCWVVGWTQMRMDRSQPACWHPSIMHHHAAHSPDMK